MASQPLNGSEREPIPGALAVGKADPDERLEVTVLVRRRAAADLARTVQQLASGAAGAAHLRREEFAARHGADPADLAAVDAFAAAHGLVVVQKDAARRTLVLAGTVAQCNAAFGVDLQRFEHAGGSYRGRTGPIHLPQELHGIVEAVLGLDNRPQAAPRFRARNPLANARWQAAGETAYTPPEVAALYGFPAGTGAGECIALIELGGGFRKTDLEAYFARLGIARPSVKAVSVDHGRNHPTGDPNGPDGEVMLDIEVAGAIAPEARIAVYFAPNTDAGFLDAITTAVHDPTNKPSVISISWGGPESSWTSQALTAFDAAFQDAAALGITVCAASGDGGASDGASSGNHVDFPASSPHCLGCGGTRLVASGSTIGSETVWNDGASGGATGGGISTAFALPTWQKGLHATTAAGKVEPLAMRGVPDVAGDADPVTGYDVQVDGRSAVIGGTSAVAPLWAGLIARINAARGAPVGLVNPRLYADPAALRAITQGNNGGFAASAGWNACTGLGSPNGGKVAQALSAPPPAA
ncbi:MAG: S8/S53 family peptidase [Alphaproteobacteria bacterium]|nr:S8/S53 family peptidase [Alphaproteobacteria bacterium]